jgi:hypothetical protein
MALCEDRLQVVLLHLGHCRRAMQALLALSDDWAAVAEVEDGFRGLRDTLRGFARHHGAEEGAGEQVEPLAGDFGQ